MPTYGQRKDTQSQVDEHITDSNGVSAKKTLLMGRDSSDNFQDVLINADGSIGTNGLVPEAYDSMDLTYTGDNLTGVVYKKSGTTVATLTLGYSGSTLTSVVRT